MPALASDQDIAARVLAHARDGTTDTATEVWHEPVANYRSAERLHREIVRVLRCTPTPFCPSAALPEKGSYVTRDAAGIPLLAVRGDDGVVRAFRNSCRHRGTPVAEGTGCASVLVCPYHGWTYRLDGSLKLVPHADGFPGLDLGAHGLVPVRADEKLGIVFVTQSARDDGSDDARIASTWDGMPELVTPEQELLDVRSGEIAVNWKVYLEGFLEGYHIRPAHPKTFFPYGYDNLNVIERCGRNSRITFPFRRIEKLASVAPNERRVDGLLTYVYHLFPNVLVTVLSHHTNIVVLEPVAVDRTRAVLYTLANRGDGTDKESAKRDAAFVNDTGGAEDLALVLAIQRSIGSGANDVFTFGEYEGLITHFHRNLREALGEPTSG
jgi:phenylpropionate dioxygenase-like ring-hydroxylating dioxygenase large terminal subunit